MEDEELKASNGDKPENIDWKEWKKERREKRKRWKEQKLLKEVEKQNKKKKVEAEDKAKTAAEESKILQNGRSYTVSIAVPGSILDNAQSPDLRTYLAGQIARAAVVFNVDEIVVFDELATAKKSGTTDGEFKGIGKKGQANVQMGRILQYLECPQYLRKHFFPIHKDLEYAGLLNPLDCYHHLREHDQSIYREGIVLNKPAKEGKGSYVGVGTRHEVQIDRLLKPGVRVTVKIDEECLPKRKWKAKVVSPSAPREEAGLYWGYNVRLADGLSNAINDSPYNEKYDLVIGTSERGDIIDDIKIPKFKHLLIVFGGLKGLEACVDGDLDIKTGDPKELFQLYLNTCPNQGSRTIRTEEAILVTMSSLRSKIDQSLS